MEIIIHWDDGVVTHQYCDTCSFRMDYKALVVFIGNDARSFHLDDITKVVVKGDN